jgi:hypothetical protein
MITHNESFHSRPSLLQKNSRCSLSATPETALTGHGVFASAIGGEHLELVLAEKKGGNSASCAVNQKQINERRIKIKLPTHLIH